MRLERIFSIERFLSYAQLQISAKISFQHMNLQFSIKTYKTMHTISLELLVHTRLPSHLKLS